MDYDDGTEEQFYCSRGVLYVHNAPSNDDVYEPEEGELITVVFNKKSRIVNKPSLEILRDAPSSPHLEANLSYEGYYYKTDEGQWLRLRDNIKPIYAWIGKGSIISKF